MEKSRLSRPRDASPGFGPLIKSPAPTTNGASPIASNGKSETPSRIKNSNTPARAAAIGAAIRPIVVNSRGLGVVAPNPMTRATTESEPLVADQPAKTKRADCYCELSGCAYAALHRNTIRSIEGRAPRPRRSHAGFQGNKILANFLIRSQQLAECHASGAAIASVKFFAESMACPTGDIDEGSSSPRSSTDVSRSRKAGSAVTGSAANARTACSSATSATIVLRAATLLSEPLLVSVARLAISG